MNPFKAIGDFLFGGSSSGKSVVETVAETVERYNPGEVKQHEMKVEDQKLTNESLRDARAYSPASHDTWFDVAIDGWARAIRPMVSTYVCLVLFGWVDYHHLSDLSDQEWELIWLVLIFWFGQRALLKDLPSAIGVIKQVLQK